MALNLFRNILVTGGAGFIGSHLVDRLLKESRSQVTVVDDFNDFYSPELKRANVLAHQGNPAFKLIEVDIRDKSALAKLFHQSAFDCIVHLAARAGVRPSIDEPLLYSDVNIAGTLNLLALAREYGVEQFVFGSSSSVYGINARVPFCEEDPVSRPISPYAATKAACELLCHTYSHLHGIRSVCLRFFTVYGPRQRPDLAICKFTRLITEGAPIPIFGDGTSRRDYTFIDDIIQGVTAAMNYDSTMFEVINLGEARTIELRELVKLLEDSLNLKAHIDRQPFQRGDVPQTYADISKARRLLGYEPKTPIEDGVELFIQWFRDRQKGTM